MDTRQGAKYIWHLPSSDQQQTLALAAHYNISIPVAQVLVSRGYTDFDTAYNYLFSDLERDVAHPALLKDAQKAVDRIVQALEKKEKILVCGDYDVDGITSSALMMLCLQPLDANINFFLPHRVKDGYGLSVKTVLKAAQNGYQVLITVDNGITAHEPARVAAQHHIDLIITDHHKPHDQLPEAYAIINPHQADCPYPFKYFAGVGVTFKILSLLYERLGRNLPLKAYELLMLGTIADVVPLIGENRFWVRQGLQLVNKVHSGAFTVLKKNGNVDKPRIRSSDIGFGIAPQINALGRLQDPRQGVSFLIGTDQQHTQHVGNILYELNQARKEIERSIVSDIEKRIASKQINLDTENIIMALDEHWPPGVIGLVASRLVSAYNRPALVMHAHGDVVKGSCRSIAAFNMFDALHQARHLLTQFGGHAQAAGLSLPRENVPALKEHLENYCAQHVPAQALVHALKIDAYAVLADLNKKCMEDIELLEPFGNSNEQPVFCLEHVVMVQKPTLLKDAHVKCMIFSDGVIKPLVFFNRPELYELFERIGSQPFAVAGRVVENYWNGKTSVELVGLDVAYDR